MKKILIIRLSSLGDVILTTPVTRALKEQYKDSTVHILTKTEYSRVFYESPFVDDVIEFDSSEHPSLRKLHKFAKTLDKNDYDIIIDLHKNLRSMLISYFMKVPEKLTYKKGIVKRRLLASFLKIRFKRMPHTIDRYLKALRPLGISSPDRLPFMFLSKDDEEFADNFFVRHNVTKDTLKIAVAPGAKNRSKMYPKEKFTNLIDMITGKLDAHVILIGSKNDESVIDYIHSNVADKGNVSRLTTGTIKESAAVIERCSKLITNDSGPMHIAVSVGTPVIALFGPTDKRFGFFPLGEDDIVISKEYPCSPCSLHGGERCKKHGYNFKCLNDITEDEIFSYID
jgi:lipopolysaccharide heptosyltransferase II